MLNIKRGRDKYIEREKRGDIEIEERECESERERVGHREKIERKKEREICTQKYGIWLSLSCVPWFPGTMYPFEINKTSCVPWKLGYA